jgi:hypothetical protein
MTVVLPFPPGSGKDTGIERGAPREIRTLVLALKGLRPGPLDDGGNRGHSTIARANGQEISRIQSVIKPGLYQCVAARALVLPVDTPV